MPKVTYKPGVGDVDVVEVFGKVFEAGKATEVTDERHLEKLSGNPFFEVAGAKPEAEAKADEENDRVLAKALDGRTKAAREARAKADQAAFEAAQKEREQAAVQVIADRRSPGEPTFE